MSTNLQRGVSRASRGRVRALAGLACALAVVSGLSACETLRVGSDYDRAVNFTDYHSFAWLPREDYGVRKPLVVERIRADIQTRLEQKGYTYASNPEAADFAV